MWPVASTTAQASARHVHFDLGSTSAALGGSLGPLGQHIEGDNPFTAPTSAQPSNQVSNYFIDFIIYFSINLIQGGFSSFQYETFDLGLGADYAADSSQEDDAGPDAPVEPSLQVGPSMPNPHPGRAQKAGSRLANSGDDALRFFQVVNEKKQCKFCL